MKKVLILYASSTGNTEEIAHLLAELIDESQYDLTLKNLEMEDIDDNLLPHYDGILFGTYTYDDGNLPFETEVFKDSIRNIDLTGKTIGVFGSGDTAYFEFCQAVDEMKVEFKVRNARVIEHTVKVDLFPDEKEELEAIKQMADLFQKALHEQVVKTS